MPRAGTAFPTMKLGTASKVRYWPPSSKGVETSISVYRAPTPYPRHYDHAWYVLEGAVQFACGERVISAPAGTFVLVPKGVAHTFANPAAVPARMLGIDAPGGFEPYFEDLAAAIPEGVPVDAALVVAIQRQHDTYPPER